jgi:two-component system OmpR family response regulator
MLEHIENSTAHILLADDDDIFSRATVNLLCQKGYACDGVTNTTQAIAAMQDHLYDVLIANLNICSYRELELLRANCRSQAWMPTIVVTDSPSLHTAVEALRLSAVDYFLKPVEPSTLLHSIRLAVEQQDQRRVRSALPYSSR